MIFFDFIRNNLKIKRYEKKLRISVASGLFFTLAAIAATILSCNNNEPEVDKSTTCFFGDYDLPREKSKSTHAFYVDNRLNEKIHLEVYEHPLSRNDIGEIVSELSPDYQINFYGEITVEPNTRMLVRYYDRSVYQNSEALNAFYYPLVLMATDPEYSVNRQNLRMWKFMWEFEFRKDYLHSKEVWIGDYWSYEQIDRWAAEYTLVVDEAFIRKLYPSPDYDYYDFGF